MASTANDKAIKGEKNKKTTDDAIPGKEKAMDRRESSLPPKQSDPDESGPKSNQDEPKAEKQRRAENDKDKGDQKPKKKNKERKSKN